MSADGFPAAVLDAAAAWRDTLDASRVEISRTDAPGRYRIAVTRGFARCVVTCRVAARRATFDHAVVHSVASPARGHTFVNWRHPAAGRAVRDAFARVAGAR